MMLWEQFNKNEIFLLIYLASSYIIVFFFPKKFKPSVVLLSFLWGLTIGMMFDFSIGGGSLDYYKTNDANRYELFDLVYFLIYGPFGYSFFYFYELLKINKRTFALYILGWALIGVFFQWLLMKTDILTLQNGYKLSHSFIIFLITQTISGIYYQKLRKKEQILLK